MNRLKAMPVPLLPTMVGAMTLSNVYLSLGFPFLRHLTMIAGALVWLVYCVKIIKFPGKIKEEYSATVLASLYAGFTMMMMIFGSYLFPYSPTLGKLIWSAGLAIHACHILVFTYRNVIKNRNKDTFLPSWFVTYNGIMVSVVIGGAMGEPAILTAVTYYGIAAYAVLIALLIPRLLHHPIKPNFLHTQAIVLAPCSLCLVSYLNAVAEPMAGLVYLLYGCVLASLAFVIYKLPTFFSVDFNPGFAGMTFPMAIGIVASTKAEAFFSATGSTGLATFAKQLSGIQIYLTSMLVGYVLLNFIMLALQKSDT